MKHPQYAHYDQQRFRPEWFSDAAFSNSAFLLHVLHSALSWVFLKKPFELSSSAEGNEKGGS